MGGGDGGKNQKSQAGSKKWTVCHNCGEWVYNWRLRTQGNKCRCGQKLKPFTGTKPKLQHQAEDQRSGQRSSSPRRASQNTSNDEEEGGGERPQPGLGRLRRECRSLIGLLDPTDPLVEQLKSKCEYRNNEMDTKTRPPHIQIQALLSKMKTAEGKVESAREKVDELRAELEEAEADYSQEKQKLEQLQAEKLELDQRIEGSAASQSLGQLLQMTDGGAIATAVADNPDLQMHIGKLWGIMQTIQAAMPQMLQAQAPVPTPAGAGQQAAGAGGAGADPGRSFVVRPGQLIRWHTDGSPPDPRQNRLPFSPSRSSSSGAARSSPYGGGGGDEQAAAVATATASTAQPATAGFDLPPPMPAAGGGAMQVEAQAAPVPQSQGGAPPSA